MPEHLACVVLPAHAVIHVRRRVPMDMGFSPVWHSKQTRIRGRATRL
jgi:hypothetical protein